MVGFSWVRYACSYSLGTPLFRCSPTSTHSFYRYTDGESLSVRLWVPVWEVWFVVSGWMYLFGFKVGSLYSCHLWLYILLWYSLEAPCINKSIRGCIYYG